LRYKNGADKMLSNADLQRSQSFKDRRISLFAQKCKEVHGPDVHLIIASGGNAGLAVACAANVLNVRCTAPAYIVEGVSRKMLYFLMKERAEIVIVGKSYVQALERAQEAVEREKNACVLIN